MIMKRRKFIKSSAQLCLVSPFSTLICHKSVLQKMNLQLLRHATLLIEINGKRFLLDPMLSEKEAMAPIRISANDFRIPMTSLPVGQEALSSLLSSLDGVLITHSHRDHWDAKAQESIPKNIPVYCQPEDEALIKKQGFEQVHVVQSSLKINDIEIHRTSGQHGTGEIGRNMGPVSGFVLKTQSDSLYIAGDTIYCEEVEDTISRFKPSYIVLNAGEARFDEGDPITMKAEDVEKVIRFAPDSQIIAVHMNSINHCRLSRQELIRYLDEKKLNCFVPADGETIKL
jgi:L-ascorbate metabolism protein UlaG (beta-lactamase superfamily)